MNQINQIIIEGLVSCTCKEITLFNEKKAILFEIENKGKHYISDNLDIENESNNFIIITYNNGFINKCKKLCKKNQKVRIIGRLKQEKFFLGKNKLHETVIVIEQIEFKEF